MYLARQQLSVPTARLGCSAMEGIPGASGARRERLSTVDQVEFQRRASLVEQFVETLIVMKHGGDQRAFAENLATAQFAFVSVDKLRPVLQSMQQEEMAAEDGCKAAFEGLDGGTYTLGNAFVELRQIARDTLQYRLVASQIESAARTSEGVPVAVSRQPSSDDATRTCWVGGIPDKTSVEQLKQQMAQFGEVVSCSMRAKPGGSYAFVVYATSSGALAAQEGQLSLGGVELKVDSVDLERLQARKGRRASIGASNAVWEAARG